MGAEWSRILAPNSDSSSAKAGLGDLPELCAAKVLLHLDPPEISRLARLNRVFRGAASADYVWEAKLPANYRYLIDLAEGTEQSRTAQEKSWGKREIYARLSRPVPLAGGIKEFWLDKRTGGLCIAISSNALLITGIDDRRYWSHIPTSESRFHSVAYLQQIWWFEVVGEINFCFPAGTYSVFFRLHLGRPSRRFGCRIVSSDHVHGWDVKPAHFQLTTSDGQRAFSQCKLSEPGSWIMYHVGDFIASGSGQPMKVKFWAAQIDITHTKGGLCLDGVFIYPKGLRHGNGSKA